MSRSLLIDDSIGRIIEVKELKDAKSDAMRYAILKTRELFSL